MNRTSINKKADAILTRQAHIQKCVSADICPDCGAELVHCGGENIVDVGCAACGEEYTVKKYWLFGPEVTKRRMKIWDMWG